jgi:hypothetical protein
LETLFWESLPEALAGGFKFEAILCLGNSICLVEDDDGRMECLEALRKTLRDEDALLLVDERNFQYMLDHAQAIMDDPIHEFAPTMRGDLLYCGQTIRGYPAIIEPESYQVRWRFFENTPRVHSLHEIEEARIAGEDLVLHAFRYGELHGLLTDAGFCTIRTYADCVDVTPQDCSMPPRAEIADAKFITYVAARGSDGL